MSFFAKTDEEANERMERGRRFMRLEFTCPGCLVVPAPEDARFDQDQIMCVSCLSTMQGTPGVERFRVSPSHNEFIKFLKEIEDHFRATGVPFRDDIDTDPEEEEEEEEEMEEEEEGEEMDEDEEGGEEEEGEDEEQAVVDEEPAPEMSAPEERPVAPPPEIVFEMDEDVAKVLKFVEKVRKDGLLDPRPGPSTQ